MNEMILAVKNMNVNSLKDYFGVLEGKKVVSVECFDHSSMGMTVKIFLEDKTTGLILWFDGDPQVFNMAVFSVGVPLPLPQHYCDVHSFIKRGKP